MLLRRLKDAQVDGPGRNETLVDENIDRIRMIDSEQSHFVRVRSFPELFGQLQDVPPIARLERVARNPEVFLGSSSRGESTRSTHQSKRHSQRAAPHCICYESKTLSIPRVRERARSL